MRAPIQFRKESQLQNLNPIQYGLFRGCSWMVGAFWPPLLPKIPHTYPTIILYLTKIQKMYKSRDTSFEFCWYQHFSAEISKFFYNKKYTYRLEFDEKFLILLTFPESLVIVLINMVTILMMSAKITTPCFLKLRVFWNKICDVIIFVYDVTNKILPHDSNYFIDVVMWPKFNNCSISMRKVIITSIL